MDKMIAYCGLDCRKCDAYKATVNNDDELRTKTAELWTKLNGVKITKEMINCFGCRGDGAKTPFCDKLCRIKKCASGKHYETCADCKNKEKCETLSMITGNNEEARNNLKK